MLISLQAQPILCFLQMSSKEPLSTCGKRIFEPIGRKILHVQNRYISVATILFLDPVPRSRDIFLSMRFLEQIKILVVLAATFVVFSAPVAAARVSHACCPDPSAFEVTLKADNLASHFQHVGMSTSSLDFQIDQVDTDTTISVETSCEISSCMNVLSSVALSADTLGSSSWDASSQALLPASETAFSVAENHHTPPPRIS